VDERSIKANARTTGLTVEQTALELALAKANAISANFPECLVLGADQILECQSEWFDKPTDRNSAEIQLKKLRGKSHTLVNALTIILNGQRLWSYQQPATLEMRYFSDTFLNRYLDQSGENIYHSVGGYLLERQGAQLFDRIDGDYFTILGLPLLPLMAYLRDCSILDS